MLKWCLLNFNENWKNLRSYTAVMAPTISKDFASSGYHALAAPSNMMKKWFGLLYQQFNSDPT